MCVDFVGLVTFVFASLPPKRDGGVIGGFLFLHALMLPAHIRLTFRGEPCVSVLPFSLFFLST